MIGLIKKQVSRCGAHLREAWRVVDVILHLGAHRTATTSFQTYLERERGALAAQRVAVWTPERTRSGVFAGLIGRPEDNSPSHVLRAARSSGLIRIETQRLENQGFEALVVSEENMIGAARDNLRSLALYPNVLERLDRFRTSFSDRCTRIGIAVRDYESYWSSALAFAIARGHRFPGLNDLEQLVHQPRRWRHVIMDAARAFPRAEVVVWSFDGFAARPNVAFSALTGRSAPRSAEIWCNKSPTLDRLRRVLDDAGQDARPLPRGNGRWKPFSDRQSYHFRTQYETDLDWLRSGADGAATFYEHAPEAQSNYPINKTQTEVCGALAANGLAASVTGGRLYGKH